MKSNFVSTSFGQFAYESVGHSVSSILFLHGGAANVRAWDGVVDCLSGKYRCISIDLPAHGLTQIQQLPFEALSQAIAEITQSLSLVRPYLVGHSFGGLVGITSAIYQGEAVAGVMTLDSFVSSLEVKGSFSEVAQATTALRNMEWPWREVQDLEPEVERCLANLSVPRKSTEQSKAMIRRGYRLQENGSYVRYPRVEEEIGGVVANWSIDIEAIYSAVPSRLCIALAKSGLPNLPLRREVTNRICSHHANFSSLEFDCGHDIPGFLPDELAQGIDQWISAAE